MIMADYRPFDGAKKEARFPVFREPGRWVEPPTGMHPCLDPPRWRITYRPVRVRVRITRWKELEYAVPVTSPAPRASGLGLAGAPGYRLKQALKPN